MPRLEEVDVLAEPATKTLLRILNMPGIGGFIGAPRQFYVQLSVYLRKVHGLEVDTRRLESAVTAMWQKRHIAKSWGGPGFRYVVGISLPGHRYRAVDLRDTGHIITEMAPVPD